MRQSRLGLTEIYSRFHSPEFSDSNTVELRRLHREIDSEVISAYGWSDVVPMHDFHWAEYVIDPDKRRYTVSETVRLELMRRLSSLNRSRWQDEQTASQSLQAAHLELTAPSRSPGRSAPKKSSARSTQAPLFE